MRAIDSCALTAPDKSTARVKAASRGDVQAPTSQPRGWNGGDPDGSTGLRCVFRGAL